MPGKPSSGLPGHYSWGGGYASNVPPICDDPVFDYKALEAMVGQITKEKMMAAKAIQSSLPTVETGGLIVSLASDRYHNAAGQLLLDYEGKPFVKQETKMRSFLHDYYNWDISYKATWDSIGDKPTKVFQDATKAFPYDPVLLIISQESSNVAHYRCVGGTTAILMGMTGHANPVKKESVFHKGFCLCKMGVVSSVKGYTDFPVTAMDELDVHLVPFGMTLYREMAGHSYEGFLWVKLACGIVAVLMYPNCR